VNDVDKWRRRERGLAIGIVGWATAVGILSTLYAETVAAWLVGSSGAQVAGVILLSIGIYGGIGHSVFWWFDHRIKFTTELTEWEGS